MKGGVCKGDRGCVRGAACNKEQVCVKGEHVSACVRAQGSTCERAVGQACRGALCMGGVCVGVQGERMHLRNVWVRAHVCNEGMRTPQTCL